MNHSDATIMNKTLERIASALEKLAWSSMHEWNITEWGPAKKGEDNDNKHAPSS